MLHDCVQKLWYQEKPFWLLLFAPLSYLYSQIMKARAFCYKNNIFAKQQFPLPVVVVGNLTVGGTGKTPLVIHIANLLKQSGLRPGIVLRGYKGRTRDAFHWVTSTSSVEEVGDEARLLQQSLDCPLVVAKKRVIGVSALVESGKVDVILSDDGLQHLALVRDIEIAVLDGSRMFGNGYCLPVGPLREPKTRLRTVDFVVINQPIRFDEDFGYEMTLKPLYFYSGGDPEKRLALDAFKGQRAHWVAGIGCPERFFETVSQLGVIGVRHPFPDHYAFQSRDLEFNDELPVLMTEKDAVKCQAWMKNKHWVLKVEAVLNPLFDAKLVRLLKEKCNG